MLSSEYSDAAQGSSVTRNLGRVETTRKKIPPNQSMESPSMPRTELSHQGTTPSLPRDPYLAIRTPDTQAGMFQSAGESKANPLSLVADAIKSIDTAAI